MDILANYLFPNKGDILDPLSLIIKLYIYSYKPIGTKISLLNNKIDIQEASFVQFAQRTINGDTKNDLINILFPLTFACEIYLTENDSKSFQYKQIFSRGLIALDKLNEVYQVNEITHNIEQLKSILVNFLNNPNFNPVAVVLNWNEPSSMLKKSFYGQTNLIWTTDRINILFGFINEIQNCTSEELKKKLISSLCSFMDYIDTIVVKLITNLHLLR